MLNIRGATQPKRTAHKITLKATKCAPPKATLKQLKLIFVGVSELRK
jgi:hypothetical protein